MMYQVMINDEVVQTTNCPCWCLHDARLRSYRSCEYDVAEAIYVTRDEDGEYESFFADILEKPYYRHDGFPVAIVSEVEGGES